MVDHDEEMHAFCRGLLWRDVGIFEEMPDFHEFLDVVHCLAVGTVQDQGLSVPCDFEGVALVLDGVGKRNEHRPHVNPVQVSSDGMLEDRVVGGAMGSGKL